MKSENKNDNLNLQFIIDEYTLARGEPQFLKMYCSSCNQLIMIYQKDGPGPLKRCYFDRIHYPETLKNLDKDDKLKNTDKLICQKCKSLIGEKIIYQKENRLAFHLNQETFYLTEVNE